MISRPGKATIAQYICYSNGLPPKAEFPNGYDEKQVPIEILHEKLKTELRGINRDVIAEYFKKLDLEYKANLNKETQSVN